MAVCLPWTFDNIDNFFEPSIVCVVTPLTAIVEDQVPTRSYVNNILSLGHCYNTLEL